MKRIVVASHGKLSAGILDSASLIGGNELFSNIVHLSITMDMSHERVREMVDEAFSAYDMEDEILALTDVYGGSITTVISEYIGIRNLHIITGVNLGMLLEAGMLLDQMEIEELVHYLMKQGKDGIRYVNEELSDAQGEEI